MAAGTQLHYTLSGVTASEVVGGAGALTGTVTVGSNGTVNFSVTLTSNPGQGLSGNLSAALSVPAGASNSSVLSASVALTETAAPPPPMVMTLTVLGDTIFLNGTTGNISLSGADLTAYPSASYGTVALAAAAGIITVNDTAGNGTLSAAGNAHATTYNFGTGVVGGADTVDGALIYTGITTYVASNNGDTVTLSAAGQNVTGGAGNDTVAFAALTPTGIIALAGGTNHVTATVGGDLSAATITATGGTADLTLGADGTETLNTAEYNLFNATGITFTGSAGPSHDTIAFSNAGTVTANSNVYNYTLATAGDTITLNNVADNVTGGAGNDTVVFAALTPTGTIALAGGTNHVTATVGGDLSAATITATGGTADLTLGADGTETLNTAEYNLFNATGITFTGSAGPSHDTLAFSNAGTVTANSNVYNYTLATAGDTITLNNAADNVTGGAGNDTVAFAALTPTGTIALAAGTNHVTATVGGDLSGATITAAGGTADLTLSADGTETLNTAEYNLFNARGITFTGSAGPSNDTVVFSDAGTVTANSSVLKYTLAANDTITTGNGNNTITGSGAGDTITTGSGNDFIQVTGGSATIKAGLGTNTIMFAVSANEIVNQGGTDTLTDTGTNNTIVLPLAGQGLDTINGSVLANGDTFDLRAALAATTWDQQLSDLGDYLTLGTSGSNALVEISTTSGGTPITIGILEGAGSVSLSSFVAHALLT